MKYNDVQMMIEAGLITDEQRQKIIKRFKLKEEGGGKFLAIISTVGAVLIVAGITLLIAAHWNEIPRGVKIATGLLLMLGVHGFGWWLREGGGDASSPAASATGASQPRGRYLIGSLALFVFCLLQIQIGIQERSPFLVNLGVVFIALDILAAYCDLFGSMARTGVMFLISGIFLIVFGVYLEKKRPTFMKQIKSQAIGAKV